MSAALNPELYEPVIVPALQRIQHEFGYLHRDELERFSTASGIPLYRLQAVASFFPHFQLAPPKKCTVKVCRDMACHLAGSAETLRDLQSVVSKDVAVEGTSCVGRCDRAAAASITVQGLEHDLYYHKRSTEELKKIVAACVDGVPPPADHDADLAYSASQWVIDSYQGKTPEYAVVRKAVALRDASLRKAADMLLAQFGWGPERLERFREAAIQQMRVDFKVDPEVEEAVRCWQTEKDWGKGPELGGWSEALIKELGDADLRGLGGAGIPVTQKWKDVRDAVRTARARGEDDRAFIVVNGDESEPGTFKDRELLLRAPHAILEGVILAGLITEATQGFIYIRHEYEEQIEACRAEIARAEELGFCGTNAPVLGRSFHVSVFVSPGGYICGEQSALIEAMSDRRGEPRNMPPKLETNGLIDLPTLVSNVETFAWAPYICLNGGKTYADHGVNGWKGRRFFSISGDVKRPGVYEVPMGMTLRELVHGEQYCQGIVGDRALKGFAPSGPSGGFLPAKLTAEAGLPRKYLDNKTWQELASRRGIAATATELDLLDLELELNLFRGISPTQALGAGVVVYAEGRNMAVEALNSIEFYRVESCGKCVPCRLGSQKLASLTGHLVAGNISAKRWNDELVPVIKEMSKAIELASICGLGRSVPVPLLTAISFFDDDIDHHLTTGSNGAKVHPKP
jgi:NADH:ubiquinone oxidoreductase subunit F (NADH-binding)/NADH:ubiquinone oxidoreductase subunit E